MPDPTSKSPRGSSQLIFGICLLLFGGVMLAENLGFSIPFNFRLHWPIPLMVFGLVGLLFPSRHLGRVGGLWLFAVGLYDQIGMTGWFGLSWSTAWPLFLIVGGINVIINSMRRRDSTEVTHEN
jgi:hypothetical protein